MSRSRVVAVLGVVLVLVGVGIWLTVRTLLAGDRIKAAIAAQASAALGQPVTIETAVPSWWPRAGLDLGGITVGAAREVAIDRVRVTMGLRALLGGRVQDADVQVERSQIDVRWAQALLAALAAPANHASAATPPALVIDSIGSIALRDVTLVAGARSLLVDLDGALAAGDRFVVRRMHGRTGGSDLVVSGELSSLSRRTGTFAIEAETLDLDGLMAFFAAATPAGEQAQASGSAPSSAPTPTVPLQLDVTIAAKRGGALGVAFTNLSTSSRVRGSAITLDGLKMDLLGGRFDGAAAFDGSGREPRYDWRGTFEGLDVPALVAFAGAPGSLTGRLSGSLALSATGVEPLAAMQRARGTARVAITDGKIPHLDLVRPAVLAFGKPTGDRPSGSGEAFSRLAASLSVGGQTLSTSDLTLSSRDLDMTGAGTLSLASQAVDLRANLMLSQELSAQAGRDLYRLAREGNRVVVPARITGSVASPTVFVDVAAALQRAIRNRAEDEIKGFLDRLGKRK